MIDIRSTSKRFGGCMSTAGSCHDTTSGPHSISDQIISLELNSKQLRSWLSLNFLLTQPSSLRRTCEIFLAIHPTTWKEPLVCCTNQITCREMEHLKGSIILPLSFSVRRVPSPIPHRFSRAFLPGTLHFCDMPNQNQTCLLSGCLGAVIINATYHQDRENLGLGVGALEL